MSVKLREIMNRDVHAIGPDDTTAVAARVMRKYDVGILPVVDSGGLVVGAVTDRDIAIRAVANGNDPIATRVRSIMSKHVKTCDTDQTVDDAVHCMKSQQLRRLFVVDGDKHKLVGVVGMQDLIADDDVDDGVVTDALKEIQTG